MLAKAHLYMHDVGNVDGAQGTLLKNVNTWYAPRTSP